MQTAASSLQNPAVVDLALKLYTRLSDLRIPYCGNRRLQLPCIAFPVTGLRRRNASQDQESSFTYRETSFTYDVKTVGLEDLVITTENKLRLGLRTFLLIRPWNRHDLGLPVIADDEKSVDDWSQPESPSDELLGSDPGEDESVDLESQWRALKLIVRLGQPFGAFLLAQQQGGEYKRVASDHNIIARVKDRASVSNMMDVRTLEIL
ncbi:uncharacterized protein EDB91DRAFT_1123917 [Suillus paluster]|uniref:uncharacterized protein n=1 Tax=Suillus paluster TaxID=48578 RepID=UPI001B870462|nr:uncharacterized protein EDB91DRAFT_1123917 [Suillus paluster]KAG1744695.1 hypothetical protein EDB91DRAFT_1123917 [Suillus paluster]